MTDLADEGRDARSRATQGALADEWVTVATRLTEARVNELALVLTARGVPFQRQPGRGGWELWVPLAMAPVAATELTLYAHENARAVGARPLEEVGTGKTGAVWYVAVLLAVYFALHTDLFDLDWLAAGRLDAARVLGGEWWRVVTASTLHVDLDHLLGNLGFGACFGYFVGRYLGAGVGWLGVLVAAALANGANAWVQAPMHRSIGASTAVFAALGMLVAYLWRRGFWHGTPWRVRLAPVAAGIGLLAFTGTAGENTDLLAHLFGFAAGVGAGAALGQLAPIGWLKSARVQRSCGALAAALLASAWIAAFW